MDEGAFVLNTSTFGIMDLEADMSSSPDDLLYYLTDQSQDILPFDSTHLFDDFTSVPSLSASSSSSSPASSPPSSFSFSSSPGSGCSPISSPSSCVSPSNSSSGGSSPEGPRIDVEDHFVFGSWIESALGSTDAAPTISPSQLQMGSHHVSLDLTPQILALSPPPSSNDDDEESADSPPARRSAAGKKDTRKRKRTKKSSDEALPQTAVSLPRDELLKLSSQELEEYAENLRKVRKLTSEEEKDLRRQRRLIKNRESAQLSRVRRREHMEVLEQQLQEVQNENARLKLQVESLTTENLQLKQHIASSSSLVVPPRSPLLSANNASTETDEPSPSLIKMVQGWTTLGKGATATAVKATYLFVILLSIGLFFNARFVHYGPGLGPFEMGHRAVGMPSVYQFPAPESVRAAAVEVPPPPSSKLDSSSHFQRATRGHRDLLELSGDADSMEMADVVNPKKNVELIVSKKTNNKIEPEQVYVDSEKVDMDVKWSRRDTLSSSAAFVHSSSSTTVSAMATGEYANKTILMCPTFSPVHWPGEEMSADAEEITFLLPASSASYIPASRLRTDYSSSSASSSFPATAKQASGNVVQLTCKIVDARMTSLSSLLVQ